MTKHLVDKKITRGARMTLVRLELLNISFPILLRFRLLGTLIEVQLNVPQPLRNWETTTYPGSSCNLSHNCLKSSRLFGLLLIMQRNFFTKFSRVRHDGWNLQPCCDSGFVGGLTHFWPIKCCFDHVKRMFSQIEILSKRTGAFYVCSARNFFFFFLKKS